MTILQSPRVIADTCAACGCRWNGEPAAQPDACKLMSCVCHEPDADACDNCSTITTDYTRLDPGRGRALWAVCGPCRDKWAANAEASS